MPPSKGRHAVPVLVIDTDNLDFVRDASDLKKVEEMIREALLHPPLQPTLPLVEGS